MNPDPLTTFDAAIASRGRSVLTSGLDTAGLRREFGAEVLARSVFTARGTNAIFANKLKEVIDAVAAGSMGEGQARTALYEVLDALDYDVEKGGFPGEEVPPALRGSLQDLRSFRRMNLIVRMQVDLMAGAGLKARGQTPDRLATHPAWELVRVEEKAAPRDWPSRWAVAGGRFYGTSNIEGRGRMIALKGDSVWGELGAWENFPDALGVDYPPFAFNSGMGWDEIEGAEVELLGVTGPDGESVEEFQASQPQTLGGRMPLPAPQISLADVDPELVKSFQDSTFATASPRGGGVMDFSDLLADSLRESADAYQKANPDYDPNAGGTQ